jgi:hypothetical protein
MQEDERFSGTSAELVIPHPAHRAAIRQTALA